MEKSPQLIIIRGNSGSGKTTLAKILQKNLPGAMLISQDVVRRDMLGAPDKPNNPNIALIGQLAEFGRTHCLVVIIEGIMAEVRYGKMLRQTMANFSRPAQVYYFDLSFEETLARHAMRGKSVEFGEDKMKKWFLPHDVLNVPGETILDGSETLETIAERISATLPQK